MRRDSNGQALSPALFDDRSFDERQLNGPDQIAMRCEQLVNRWVYLAHQRPVALQELQQLIEVVRKERT